MKHKAFTMIELVFVIVVIGIIAKFGVEFLIKAYDAYINSAVQNRLQTQTELALEQVANRLQYRIKPSVIVRNSGLTAYLALSNATGSETILEWVGYDIDGFRGTSVPNWSGFIDLNSSTGSILNSPATDTGAENTMISLLSNGTAGINNAAIFFIGANTDINGFGWDGVAINDQNHTMHPITSDSTPTHILPNGGTFSGTDVYEFYQLAWTAYALVYSGTNNSNATTYINQLDSGDTTPSKLFDTNGSVPLMSTGIANVTGTTKNGDWTKISTNTYVVKVNDTNVTFTYTPATGSFDCTPDSTTAGQLCARLRG